MPGPGAYSELVAIATSQGWKTKKTYNNGISSLRCAFEFGYKDYPDRRNPAEGLDCFRITKKDRPKVDPNIANEKPSANIPVLTVADRAAIRAACHFGWGDCIVSLERLLNDADRRLQR